MAVERGPSSLLSELIPILRTLQLTRYAQRMFLSPQIVESIVDFDHFDHSFGGGSCAIRSRSDITQHRESGVNNADT